MITHPTFEKIKHTNKIGREYWSTRELNTVLEYIKWDNYHPAVASTFASPHKPDQNFRYI